MRDKHCQSSPPSAPLPSAPFSHFGAWVAVWSPHLWQNVTISACFTEKKSKLGASWRSVGLDHLELWNHLFQQTSANSWTSRHVSDLWIFVALSSDSSGLTTQLVVFHLNFHCSCANYCKQTWGSHELTTDCWSMTSTWRQILLIFAPLPVMPETIPVSVMLQRN